MSENIEKQIEERDLDRDEFAAEAMRRLNDAGFTGATYDREEFALRSDGIWMNLQNHFDEYCRSSLNERRGVLDRMSRGIRECREQGAGGAASPRSFDEVRQHLRPKVRELMEVEAMRRAFPLEEQCAYRPLGAHLIVSPVIDRPDCVIGVTPAQLKQWGISFDEALDVATKNLAAESTAMFVSVAPGVLRSAVDDSYDGSRIVLNDVLRGLPVRGDPVAVVAGRDHLLVTGSDDARGLVSLAQIAEVLGLKPRAMSGFPVRLVGDGWVHHHVPPAHPAWFALRRLELPWQFRNYKTQQGWLRPSASGDGLFIAPFMIYSNPDHKQLFSLTNWTAATRSSLPRAEWIVFNGSLQTSFSTVAWERFATIVGEKLALVPDLYPERFVFDGVLTSEQDTALKTAARERPSFLKMATAGKKPERNSLCPCCSGKKVKR